ncbi:MAG: 3-deoxy-8-phosphooctulonate synthase [Planctomycetota bacterium]|nr:MAG: 3-deoxy-8-phosphooctulonate synthase [Planctomycetota bacterium]
MRSAIFAGRRWGEEFFFIAGPCVIEDEEWGEGFTLEIGRKLREISDTLGIPFIFKASFDKANRTSHRSFRGPGLERGLAILREVKEELQVPILTDVHACEQVEPASEVADVLQIPAFLCRQTDLILEASRRASAVNLKKGQFLAPWDMEHVVAKVESVGQRNIFLTERGTCFGYNALVSDMRSIVWMKRLGYPVVFDGTHSVQVPGGGVGASGGMPEMIAPLSRAAVAAGADGVFLEVHPSPQKALSDGANALRLDLLAGLLLELRELKKSFSNS